MGRPWILPSVITRTIVFLVVTIGAIWLEFILNTASPIVLGVPVWMLTLLFLLVIWLVTLVPLLLMRSAHKYTLRSGSLEVKTGLASTRNFVLSASGFSDLEVCQSVVGRIVNSGDIIIHTQSDRTATMKMVKDPNTVASQIREFMGRPIVRIEGEPPR